MRISKETRALIIVISGIAFGMVLYVYGDDLKRAINANWLRRIINPDGFNRLVCAKLITGAISDEEASYRMDLPYEKDKEGHSKFSAYQFCRYYGPVN